MRKEDIMELAGKFVTDEEFDAICESECVVSVDNCGNSGNNSGVWYNVVFTDGTDIDIYG